MEELPKAPDDILSITAAFSEVGLNSLLIERLIHHCLRIFPQIFQAKFTMGPTILTNRYHVGIVRNQLTRSLGVLFSALREEVILSMEENIPLTEGVFLEN